MNNRRVDTAMHVAATATGSVEVTPRAGSQKFCVDVIWPANVTAGAVAVETAPYKGYTGTWTQQTLFTIGSGSVAGSVDQWRGDGPFGAIRTRITTGITGDGITTILHEN